MKRYRREMLKETIGKRQEIISTFAEQAYKFGKIAGIILGAFAAVCIFMMVLENEIPAIKDIYYLFLGLINIAAGFFIIHSFIKKPKSKSQN